MFHVLHGRCCQPYAELVPRDRHREVEPVGRQRQLQVGGRKARPAAGHELGVTRALTEGAEQLLDVAAYKQVLAEQ